MTIEIKVPVLPESVPDATISSINHKVGDIVSEGETLLELETDKIMIEVPASSSGKIIELSVSEGDQVKTDQLLCLVDDSIQPEEEEKETANVEKEQKEVIPETKETKSIPATKTDIDSIEKVDGSPSFRRAVLTGTENSIQPILASSRREQRVAMTRIRKTIAERLIDAQQSTAALTTFNEVDMFEVMAVRSKNKKDFEDYFGVRLGFMSFFIKACCIALQKFPEVNASIDEGDIIYRDYQDIGIAVTTERGLVVPVLRDANILGMSELESGVLDLANKARDGKLTLDDMSGGTFSITNAGKFGSLLSTPILNPPQSAILGMHNIIERPVVIDGEITVRPMMYLALTYDHRMIDGATSVQFLMHVKKLLEDPNKLLLNL